MKRDLLDFFCTDHQALLSRDDDVFRCSVPSCKKVVYDNKFFYDSMGKSPSSSWDGIFERLKTQNFFVVRLNSLISKFVLPLTVDSIVDEILARHPETGRFIEIGCGEGTGSIGLLRAGDYSVVLVDSNDFALKAATGYLRNHDFHQNVLILKADFYERSLPIKEKSFDISFNIGTIEHFDDPVKVVREMARVANRVACSVPAPSPYWWIGTQIRRMIEKDHTHWTERTQYYSIEALSKIFRDAGLRNIQTSQSRLLGLPVMNVAFGDA
jgi:SAM-dependent methyltransferase